MFLPRFRYRNLVKAVIVIGVLIAFAYLIIYTKNYIAEKTSVDTTTATQAFEDMNAVYIGEDRYMQNRNKNVLIIGLDIDGEIVSSGSYNNDYNADFLLLANFNTEETSCNLVEINRDTIVPVQRLDIFGQKVDKQPMQICLSYSFGEGLGDSAKNTKTAVSDIFYGLNIDYYLVMTRDATRLAVDYLGGVQVVMDDDYTDINPAYVKGSVHTLNADEAMEFVTERYNTAPGTNVYRMQRQMCLVNSLVKGLQSSDCDYTQLYNAFSAYTLTDIDFTVFSRIMSKINSFDIPEVETLAGKAMRGSVNTEFYLDDASVQDVATRVFYDRI